MYRDRRTSPSTAPCLYSHKLFPKALAFLVRFSIRGSPPIGVCHKRFMGVGVWVGWSLGPVQLWQFIPAFISYRHPSLDPCILGHGQTGLYGARRGASQAILRGGHFVFHSLANL